MMLKISSTLRTEYSAEPSEKNVMENVIIFAKMFDNKRL